MYTLIKALDTLLYVIEMALVIRAVLSWIPNLSRENPFVNLLNQVTEPVLNPIRSLIEKSSFGRNSMIDLSPLIAFLIIEVLRRILWGL
ncbi:YggT family protein [Acetivibrio cellulolyticus]|uniref:YggT family protein n=1 Tax=Acetivibrio cellulolyticus TaxID=35830 RepID=UPI0001E2D0F6|nr:YggT family protein [Acetivibrio cellulolyticus]